MLHAFISIISCDIITFISGTSLSWSSPELSIFSNYSTFDHELTTDEKSWISSLTPLGAVVGPFFFGFIVDIVGRKYTILSLAIPFFVSFMILAFSHTVALFYFARFFSGLAVGGAFTLVPMYGGEISDDKNRTLLTSLMNVFVCSGLLFSYLLGPYVSVTSFNLILSIFPVVFFILFFFFGVESPQHHVAKSEMETAKSILRKIRSRISVAEREFKDTEARVQKDGKGNITDIFKSKGLRKAIITSTALVAFQQLSGINAVLFYAQTIFSNAHVTLSPAVCSIVVGLAQFSTSFITPLVCNHFGRKTLLIFSGIGMVIFEVPLGVYCYLQDNHHDVSSISWLPIACLILYIIVYNTGFGPLPWTILAETFPGSVKAYASMLTSCSCWTMGFLITKYFQSISDSIGMGAAFWIFAGFSALSAVFSAFYVIETKDKSLQEIQDALNN